MLRNVCHYNVHQEFKALQSLATEDPPFLPIHAMNTVYSLITLNHLVPNKSNSLYHGCINWNTVSHCSIQYIYFQNIERTMNILYLFSTHFL